MLSIFLSAVSVAAVVIAGAGLVTLAVGFVRLAASARTKSWPHVEGTVLSSTVEEKVSQEPSEEDGAPARELRVFTASVKYRYKVGEKQLTGDRLSLDELETSNRNTAVELAARYPPGASISVFYEPRDPTEAVLQPGVSGGSAIIPLVGVGLVLLGAALLAISWKVSGR